MVYRCCEFTKDHDGKIGTDKVGFLIYPWRFTKNQFPTVGFMVGIAVFPTVRFEFFFCDFKAPLLKVFTLLSK